jgi:hypothetical protein
MTAIVLYHPKSDHGGRVEDFARDFKMAKNKELELLSLEAVPGDELAKLYDVTSYPAVLVKAGDGSLMKLWQGGIPSISELDSYLQS